MQQGKQMSDVLVNGSFLHKRSSLILFLTHSLSPGDKNIPFFAPQCTVSSKTLKSTRRVLGHSFFRSLSPLQCFLISLLRTPRLGCALQECEIEVYEFNASISTVQRLKATSPQRPNGIATLRRIAPTRSFFLLSFWRRLFDGCTLARRSLSSKQEEDDHSRRSYQRIVQYSIVQYSRGCSKLKMQNEENHCRRSYQRVVEGVQN